MANDPGGVTLIQAQTDPKSARQRNVDFDAGEALDQQRIGLSYRKSFGERHEIRLRNHYVWRDFANKLPFTSGGAVQFDRFFVGGGASALIGAGPKTISLQPLGLESSTGWGLAGGLGYLYLEPGR